MIANDIDVIFPHEFSEKLTPKELRSVISGISIEDVIQSAVSNVEMSYRLIAENRDTGMGFSYMTRSVEQLVAFMSIYPEKHAGALDRLHDSNSLYSHPADVQIMSVIFAMRFNESMNGSFINPYDMGIAAGLHDIGKLYVDKGILEKDGVLNPCEMTEMRDHPLHGYNMLGDVANDEIRLMVLYQHFNNGRGYPEGLEPSYAGYKERMLSAIDKYDALRSGRPYKEPMGMGQALTEISRMVDRGEMTVGIASDLTMFLKHNTTEGRDLMPKGNWLH